MKKGVENEHTPKGQEGAALMTVTSTSNETKVLMLQEEDEGIRLW